MTWKFKAQRVAFALAVLAMLAIATGANYYDCFFNYYW